MGTPLVSLDREAGRATLILQRPPLNILNVAMLEEIDGALQEVSKAVDIRVLVLRGEGRSFSAGVDVADHSEDRVEAMLRTFHRVLMGLLDLEIPTMARVHGHCLGGGLELAMVCDLVYAASGSTLGQPEIRLASFPPFGTTLYPFLLGLRGAAELILLGREVPAERALEMGLVNGVYPPDELDARIDEICSELEGNSRIAVGLAKRAMRQGLTLRLEETLREAERIYLDELMATEDAREGLAAFLEKRKPVWRDR
ncbi:MAG: enoyl-CoA hydratase/isomerase family protein [Thermoplasmata archaeon]